MGDHPGVHTLVDAEGARGLRTSSLGRRAVVAVLVLVLILALAGVLGIRSATASAQAEGWTLTVRHAVVTRAGIAVPFHVTVTKDGGIAAPFTLRISSSLPERFDFQNFYPNPAAETATGDFLLYEFDPPPGDTFRLNLDARTAPDQNGSTEVYEVAIVEDGTVVTQVDFRMWIVP